MKEEDFLCVLALSTESCSHFFIRSLELGVFQICNGQESVGRVGDLAKRYWCTGEVEALVEDGGCQVEVRSVFCG